MIPFLITLVVTAIAFIIISKLPIGVESDSLNKSIQASLVFGILNAIVSLPLVSGIFWLFTLFGLLGNIILFALAAKLVEGFRLKWGVASAVLGAIALTLVTSILRWILAQVGLVT